MSDCILNATFTSDLGCGTEWNAYLRCVGDLAPDAANWDCSFAGLPAFPAPPNCELELLETFACLGF
jgi:hypothetical protein